MRTAHVFMFGLAALAAGPALGAADDSTAQARAYVAQFTTESVDRCFTDVALEQPALEPREGTGIGLRATPSRVVVAIDASGSMAGRIGGRSKLELARDAAFRFVDGLPAAVEASLLVFGQQGDNSAAGKARSCDGVDVLAPMSTDRAGLKAAIGQVRAVGWTPLAAGLERARSLLAQSSDEGRQVIYVVSDGEETCGGDPAAVARRINQGSTRAIVNIIGFGLPSNESAALKAVADAGGGGFVNVTSRADYDRTMQEVRTANRRAANAVRASDAESHNAVRTADAVSHAARCVSDIVDSESLRMSDDLSARALRGDKLPFPDREALDALEERHTAIKARLEDYEAKLAGNEAKARDASRKAADGAQ